MLLSAVSRLLGVVETSYTVTGPRHSGNMDNLMYGVGFKLTCNFLWIYNMQHNILSSHLLEQVAVSFCSKCNDNILTFSAIY